MNPNETISWRGPLRVFTVWLLAAAYLGGPALIVAFVLMVAGLLLPLAALLADRMRGTGLADEIRLCFGGAGALLLAIPGYYLRRVTPLPGFAFDVIVVAATLAAALQTGALGRVVPIALSPTFRAAGWLLGAVVPIAACLVWMGFEVRHDGVLRYYGLFTIDFSNLSGVVAMIKASPGPPAFVTAGGGPLHYHWWFFTVAAWLSEFAGARGRCSSALALANFLAAVLLAATICAAVAEHLRRRGTNLSDRTRRTLAATSSAVVIIASLSLYAYLFVVSHLHRSWLTFGVRNNLLLSVVNSMSTFGNNTLALTLAVIEGELFAVLGEKPSWTAVTSAALAGLAICGLSVTLTLPLSLAAGAWILMGRVHQPWRLALVGVVAGAVGLPLLRATSMLGDSSQHLHVSFDHGQFIQNVALGMAPIWVLATASLVEHRRLSFAWLLIAADVLVPTLVGFVGHGAVPSTMSMKMASLLAIASAPLVAEGLLALGLGGARVGVGRPAWLKVWRAVAVMALLIGTGNSLVYAGQFAFYRLTGRGHPAEIPSDYALALDYIRSHTPADAVVVDPNGDRLRNTIGTLLIGERQVWLPTWYSTGLFRSDLDRPEIMSRPEKWSAWERGGFRDESLAAEIAASAEVLVGPPRLASASWEERFVAGDYAVYVSRRP
jgi:hypothetical protein